MSPLLQRSLLAIVVTGIVAFGALGWILRANATPEAPPRQPTGPTAAAAATDGGLAPGIVTVGEASIRAVPDQGYLAFAVQVSGKVGGNVAGDLSERVERLLGKAVALGVEESDIIRGPIQFQPQYNYDPQKGQHVVGFNAYQQIAIECDEIAGMPLLVEELMKDTATSALSVRYAPSRQGPAYQVARERAIADARAQAVTSAAAAGLKLGAAISISEVSAQPSPYGYGLTGGKFPVVGGPGFPPAEIDTVIRVQVRFAVEPLT